MKCVVVNDASCLIDLRKGGLLAVLTKLPYDWSSHSPCVSPKFGCTTSLHDREGSLTSCGPAIGPDNAKQAARVAPAVDHDRPGPGCPKWAAPSSCSVAERRPAGRVEGIPPDSRGRDWTVAGCAAPEAAAGTCSSRTALWVPEILPADFRKFGSVSVYFWGSLTPQCTV